MKVVIVFVHFASKFEVHELHLVVDRRRYISRLGLPLQGIRRAILVTKSEALLLGSLSHLRRELGKNWWWNIQKFATKSVLFLLLEHLLVHLCQLRLYLKLSLLTFLCSFQELSSMNLFSLVFHSCHMLCIVKVIVNHLFFTLRLPYK